MENLGLGEVYTTTLYKWETPQSYFNTNDVIVKLKRKEIGKANAVLLNDGCELAIKECQMGILVVFMKDGEAIKEFRIMHSVFNRIVDEFFKAICLTKIDVSTDDIVKAINAMLKQDFEESYKKFNRIEKIRKAKEGWNRNEQKPKND